MNPSKILLTLAARDLRTLVLRLHQDADEAIAWNDPTRVLPIITPLSNWIHANYNAKTGWKIEAALRDEKTLHSAAGEALERIKFNINREDKQSCLDQLTILASSLEQITGVELTGSVETLRGKIKHLKKIKLKNAGIDTREKISAVGGTQRAQADAIAEELLGRLEKKLAGKLRQRIARADNRLRALSMELSGLGIAL